MSNLAYTNYSADPIMDVSGCLLSVVVHVANIHDTIKANRCEWCGQETSALVMYQVRTLKELDDNLAWAAFMKKINRKTLVVCESCHSKIHNADCE